MISVAEKSTCAGGGHMLATVTIDGTPVDVAVELAGENPTGAEIADAVRVLLRHEALKLPPGQARRDAVRDVEIGFQRPGRP